MDLNCFFVKKAYSVTRQDFFHNFFGKLCFLWSRYGAGTGTVKNSYVPQHCWQVHDSAFSKCGFEIPNWDERPRTEPLKSSWPHRRDRGSNSSKRSVIVSQLLSRFQLKTLLYVRQISMIIVFYVFLKS
jgi:hypothetical protein